MHLLCLCRFTVHSFVSLKSCCDYVDVNTQVLYFLVWKILPSQGEAPISHVFVEDYNLDSKPGCMKLIMWCCMHKNSNAPLKIIHIVANPAASDPD